MRLTSTFFISVLILLKGKGRRMLISLLIFVGMLIVFNLIGSLLISLFKLDFGNFNFVAEVLTGVVFLSILGQWCAYLSWKVGVFFSLVTFSLLVIALLLIRTDQLVVTIQKIRMRSKYIRTNQLIFVVPTSVAFLYATLSGSGWITAKFSYRAGPDSFGWNDAVNFFRDNLSIHQLKDLIVPNLNGTPLYSALNVVHAKGTTAIYEIPSFTRQIDAEFLLGAHRTGIPYLLGSFAHIFPHAMTQSFVIAFMMIAIFAISQIAVVHFKSQKQSISVILLGVIAMTLNCNLLFQSLEGGVGELFAIPFILFVLVLQLERSINTSILNFSIGLLVALAFTSYFDILFTALPILGLITLYQILRSKQYSFKDLLKHRYLVFFLIASFTPFATSFIRLAIVPFIHPSAGGWNNGRRPLPDNIFGVLSSITNRVDRQSMIVLIIDIILSITLIAFMIIKYKGQQRFGFLVLVSMYSYLYFSVYNQLAPYNNYRLWKYSAIASSIFPLLLIQNQSSYTDKFKSLKIPRQSGNRRVDPKIALKTSQKSSLIVSGILICISITSSLWLLDWQSTKKIPLNNQEIAFIEQNASKYDFIIDGSLYSAMLTMYGDIHYGSPQRGLPGLLSHYSSPLRPIMFITNIRCSVENVSCLPELLNYPSRVSLVAWKYFPDFNVAITVLSKS